MNKKLLFTFVLISSIFSFSLYAIEVQAVPAYCDVSISDSDLPYTISQSNTYYCLAEDAYIGGQIAITFSSGIQNTSLDCLNYNINGDDTAWTIGVLDGSNDKNNTIKNCNITNFDYGIYLYSSDNTTVKNNTLNDNTYGIYFTGISDNTITNNTITNNTDGIYLATSTDNTITNNTITNNTDGIYLATSTDNTITNNTITNNTGDGINLALSANFNTITTNSINNNTQYGIYISETDSNTISGNNISSQYMGIIILNGDWNNITNNILNNNGYGIYVFASGTLTGNRLENNTIYDNNYGIFFGGYPYVINNNVTGGSVHDNNIYDYYLSSSYADNYIRNTNFTGPRTIFDGKLNYNNESSGNIWLKTTTSGTGTLNITRELINWNNTLMQWNDTNSTGTDVSVTYNISGLLASTYYTIYNNSVQIYTLQTDSSGNLPIFTIYLGSEHEIKVEGDIQPPQYFDNSVNSMLNGTAVEFRLRWTDNVGLSGHIFSTNNTGSWVNDTWRQFWWNGSWSYRKSHIISGSSAGNQTNYQMNFTIINGTGTDSGATVYIDDKMRSDFGDIRFTWYNDTSGKEQEISYWNETNYIVTNTTFWVEVPFISNETDNTIYIYYGNDDATTTSNGTSTFILFDDFDDGDYTDNPTWTVYDGTWDASNNWLENQDADVTYHSINIGQTEAYGRWKWKSKLGTTSNGNLYIGFISDRDNDAPSDGYDLQIARAGTISLENRTGGAVVTLDSFAWTADTNWHDVEITRNSTGGFKMYWDGVLKIDETENVVTTSTYFTNYYRYDNDAIDTIRISKYVDPEPSHGSWGSEETSTQSWSNVTKTLNSTVGIPIGWRVYANDTSNNWDTSQIYSLTTSTSTITITVESAKMTSDGQIISRPNSNIQINGRAFYTGNGTAHANSQLNFTYDTRSLGSNTTNGTGYYWLTFSIPYEGTYNLTISTRDISNKTGENTTVMHISTHPIYAKFKLSYHLGTTKINDVYRIGTDLMNETIDNLNKINTQYSNNLTHAYVCTYDKAEYTDGLSLSLVHSGKNSDLSFVNFSTNTTLTDYTIELKQKIEDTNLLLTYSKGTCQDIDERMYLVEKYIIPSRAFSSFSYPIPSDVPILIQFKNDRIQINGTDRFSSGSHKVCVEKSGISLGNKPIIDVGTC